VVGYRATALKLLTALLAALAMMVLASCGDETSPRPIKVESVDVSGGDIAVGDEIPTPKRKTVVEIGGLVSNPNQNDAVMIDLATLERMPRLKLRVFEPYEKRKMVFEGVLLSKLLEIAGSDSNANEIHLTALDDYKVDVPLAEIRNTDVLLATKADGKHMSISDGGPTRVIFPPDSGTGRNPDMWIWNVETITVR